jgi:hypothetical protein
LLQTGKYFLIWPLQFTNTESFYQGNIVWEIYIILSFLSYSQTKHTQFVQAIHHSSYINRVVGLCGWVMEVDLGMAGSKSKNGKSYDHGILYCNSGSSGG